MPTPVSSDCVSPSALVRTWSASEALASRSPLSDSALPVPIVASVSLAVIETATTGVTAVEPLAPFFASVSISWPNEASRVRSCAPVMAVSSPINAKVEFSP